jgi:hypothetical protein
MVAQMAWLSDHGQALKKKDISPNGIGDLELANHDNINKLLYIWKENKAEEKIPYFQERLDKTFQSTAPKTSMIDIARNDIYWDFPFIVFYSAVVFLLLSYMLSFWRLWHLKTFLGMVHTSSYEVLSFLVGKKNKIALIWAISIGLLDVIENLCMLNALANWEHQSVILPFWFASFKFILLIAAILFSLLTFLYFLILRALTSPQTIIEKFKRFAVKINNPY